METKSKFSKNPSQIDWWRKPEYPNINSKNFTNN